jgi:hypothetical protein
MQPIPFAEPGAKLPSWVATKTRPLVYLTLGTVVATDAVLLPALEGLATLDAEILLSLGSADGTQLGSLPDNVHVEAFVDQAALMGSVDLVSAGGLDARHAASSPTERRRSILERRHHVLRRAGIGARTVAGDAKGRGDPLPHGPERAPPGR